VIDAPRFVTFIPQERHQGQHGIVVVVGDEHTQAMLRNGAGARFRR
jgi:hypothetical protein